MIWQRLTGYRNRQLALAVRLSFDYREIFRVAKNQRDGRSCLVSDALVEFHDVTPDAVH